ncbi:MAG TPA: hypothetical protein DEB06_09700 [Phycisphaerales bacterium]|nr:hypothetical protein [Phycisphaerales bacterium]
MSPEVIKSHWRREPFTPFRVHVSDGSVFDVRVPEFMYLFAREVVVGVEESDEGLPSRSVYIDPLHVTRIEPINGKGTPGGR